MKFRPATFADAKSIAELHTANWRSTYAAVLNAARIGDIDAFHALFMKLAFPVFQDRLSS